MAESAMNAYPLPWREPLELARAYNDAHTVLLYSGLAAPGRPRISLLARKPLETVEGSDWQPLERVLGRSGSAYENAWFGYLGYGLKDSLERYPADAPGLLPFPALRFTRFNEIYRFNHDTSELVCHGVSSPEVPDTHSGYISALRASHLKSNMDKATYLSGVQRIIREITRGTLYQANMTRKFYGELEAPADPLAAFEALCVRSPAPYAAYIRSGERAILSSSPECFLDMDAAGRTLSRPIKGSAPRHADPAKDESARAALLASPKERAENLMIVDLMRNDLARSCIPGSVGVDSLYDITSYATVHHLSSTVSGLKRPDISPLMLVQHCFPPGSMTGAPKISAITLCTELEQQARGVYSGALGWFGGDGSAQLSVVIRTLLLDGRNFEFQVGGGIVSDSDPEAEWEETLIKAKALCDILGVTREQIACL